MVSSCILRRRRRRRILRDPLAELHYTPITTQMCVKSVMVESCHAGGEAADLEDPLAELHMEDYETDEGGEEMDTETASRLFGSGNPGRR